MELYEPPESGLEIARVRASEPAYSGDKGPFALVEVWFGDREEKHAGHIAADKMPGKFLHGIVEPRPGLMRYSMTVTWGPAAQGILREMRKLEREGSWSHATKRHHFAKLIVALDNLWD